MENLQQILEGVLFAADKTLSVDRLGQLFPEDECPSSKDIREALTAIGEACEDRGVELKEVSTGFRFQVKQDLAPWVGKLWEEKPPRYSRAFLETLSLIAYRQPVTRAEIEEVRGVAVNSHIIKQMFEREWIREVGHKDVPGRPALLGTTKQFLDYFNLKGLDELPNLMEIHDLDAAQAELQQQLDLAPDAEASDDETLMETVAETDVDSKVETETEASTESVEEIGDELLAALAELEQVEQQAEAALQEPQEDEEENEIDETELLAESIKEEDNV